MNFENKDIVKFIDITDPYKNLLVNKEYNQTIPADVLNYAGLLLGKIPTNNDIYTPFNRDVSTIYRNKVITVPCEFEVKDIEKNFAQVMIQPDFLVTKDFLKVLGANGGNFSIGTILQNGLPKDIVIPALEQNAIYYRCISANVIIESDEPAEIIIGYDLKKYIPKVNAFSKNALQADEEFSDIRNLLSYQKNDNNFVRKSTNCELNMIVDSDSFDRVAYFNKLPSTLNADFEVDMSEFEKLIISNNKYKLEDMNDEKVRTELILKTSALEFLQKQKFYRDIQESETLCIIIQPTKQAVRFKLKINYQIYYLNNNGMNEFVLINKANKLNNEYEDYKRVLLLLLFILKKVIVINIKELKVAILTGNFSRTGLSKDNYLTFTQYMKNNRYKNLLLSILNNLE